MEERKKSIYLTKTLQKIYDNTDRKRSFSGRVADIAERYDVLMDLTSAPELTDEERAIFRAVIYRNIDSSKLQHLDSVIKDTNLPGAAELANKVKRLDYVQRMKLIEGVGYGR